MKKREPKTPDEIKSYLMRYNAIREQDPDKSNLAIAQELGVKAQDISNWRRGPYGDIFKSKKGSPKKEKPLKEKRKRKPVEVVTNLVPTTTHNLLQQTQSTLEKIIPENMVITQNPTEFLGQVLGVMLRTLIGGQQ